MPGVPHEFSPNAHLPGPLSRAWLIRAFLSIACAGMPQLIVGCAPEPHTPLSSPGADGSDGREAHQFPITIHEPVGAPGIKTGTFDEHGRAVSVACATCHATRPANPEAKLGTSPTLFHQGLQGKHGNLSCVSCHNPTDGFASLRLADGKHVPFTAVMLLCAQCHGPQFRDYQHGAHGGMTGYWNLTKGGRVRNNCIDCHDPHAPKYPTVTPASGPNDRFLTGGGHE
jgi:hypothetical protein